MHGGYGIYYDRITLEIMSLERGLDGRALPIEVRAGNVFFLDPADRPVPAVRADDLEPVHRIHPARRRRWRHQHHRHACRTRRCSSSTSASSGSSARRSSCASTASTRTARTSSSAAQIGEVFNPVVGGPDSVVNLESSVGTKYDALLRRASSAGSTRRCNLRASYTLAKAFNYANDDQIPFSNGPIDPNDLQREYGPTPNDRRHRFTLAGSWYAPWRLQLVAASGRSRRACRWTS